MRRTGFLFLTLCACGQDLIQATGKLSTDSGDFEQTSSGLLEGANSDGDPSDSGEVESEDSGASESPDNSTSDAPAESTGGFPSEEDSSTGVSPDLLGPGDVCDPVDDSCVAGYACLFDADFVNQDPQQGTVWTWSCRASGQPTDNTFLEVCQANSECGQHGPCLPEQLLPNGFCLEPSCCSSYCHVGADECGPGMFCYFVLSDYAEGSYTVPADIGYCRSV